METIAVYWEPIIRVYGLTVQTGLSLYTLVFPVERLSYWGEVVRHLGQEGREFQLVSLQTSSVTRMQLCLLLAAGAGKARKMLEKCLENEDSTSLAVVSSVELIYLHGPHFQDRYGIAEAALKPLHNAGIPILSVGCAGTSVYIVVPEKKSHAAAACLSETFAL